MANENEFPKMLYRSDKIERETTEVWGYPDTHYAIAKDADEEQDMLDNGFRVELMPVPADAETAKPKKAPRKAAAAAQ